MTGVVFATQAEAAPFLARVGARPLGGEPLARYGFAVPGGGTGVVAICGFGAANAERAVVSLVRDHAVDRIVNAGLCGALREELAVGDIGYVAAVYDGDALLRGEQAPAVLCPARSGCAAGSLRPVRLASVTEPIFDPARRDRLAEHADVVEMEGFAVARACARVHVTFSLIKGVSDRADQSGRDAIRANLARVAGRLAVVLLAELASASAGAQPGNGGTRAAV